MASSPIVFRTRIRAITLSLLTLGSLLSFFITPLQSDSAIGQIAIDFCDRPSEVDPNTEFLRGDCTSDGVVDLTDAVANILMQYTGSYCSPCRDACDVDDNGSLEITDPIMLLSYIFAGGAPPAPPGPLECGPDPSVDHLTCVRGCQA